jgi:hypothetical protein
MSPFAAAMARMKALIARTGDLEPEPAPGWADTIVMPPPTPPEPPAAAPALAPAAAAPAESPLLTPRRRAVWRSPEVPGPNGVPVRNFTPVEILAEVDGWAMLLVPGDTRPCVQPASEIIWKT